MNYLAHARLSFNEPSILVGNMTSDFIKGKKKFEYPPGILQGIDLHRAIDHFTDNHDATKKAKEIFRPHYRLYSGAFIDVIYDHFLALDATEFSDRSLYDFSQQVYAVLEDHRQWLPDPFARMLPYMKNQNWLYHYRTFRGTENSLAGLVRRAAYLTESNTAFQLFTKHYQLLHEYYRQFWQDVKPFAIEELSRIQNAGNNM